MMRWAFTLALILGSLRVGFGQSNVVHKFVHGSGATNASNRDHRLFGTVGQTSVGSSIGKLTAVKAGFWASGSLIITSIDENSLLVPTAFQLDQNYPNPFNPETTIPFSLAEQAHIQLSVFDTRGRLVSRLLNEIKPAGYYKLTFAAEGLPTGLYVYRLSTKGRTLSRKFLLVR